MLLATLLPLTHRWQCLLVHFVEILVSENVLHDKNIRER